MKEGGIETAPNEDYDSIAKEVKRQHLTMVDDALEEKSSTQAKTETLMISP